MPRVIRLGDHPTDHGGKVEAVTSTSYMVNGKPVARVGDQCSCPKKGHDGCVMAEGDPNFIVDGLAVAFEGHKTSCGALLMSMVPNFGKE
jgi:uncharacterized Zn-binding protein involved in type VI secretion